MPKQKGSTRKLPPLFSGNPNEIEYVPSSLPATSPNPTASRYHKNCCLPHRHSSPGPGAYLDAVLRKSPTRKTKSSRSPHYKNSARPQSQGWSQRVSDYLRKHPDFLECYVYNNVSVELLEKWINRKAQRPQKYEVDINESPDEASRLSKLKFCVHADKREMLQELTSTIFSYPNKGHVLSELARTVAAAVNATGWNLYIYNPETEELCSYVCQGIRTESPETETSLASYVAKVKECIRLKPSEKDQKFQDEVTIQFENPVNVLCHPVIQPDGELSGVLELYKDADSEFYEEDEEIVNSYLVWGGIALHYAELYCNMMQQRELNMFLLTVVKSIFQDMISMDAVILKIMMFARKLVSADRASLFLVDGKSGELYARIFDVNGSEGNSESCNDKESDLSPEEIRFPIGKGIAGYVAMTGESLNIPDAYNDSRFNRAVDQRTGYNTRNLLCMPIFIRTSVIGVVQMVNKSTGSFTKNDEESFATFAIYCGLALHHAKLYDKIRRSEQKYKVALEILSYHSTCSEEDINTIKNLTLPIETDVLSEFTFSPLTLNSDEKVAASIFMLKHLPKVESITTLDEDSLIRFTLTVRKNYRRVPYHNWDHGFCVASAAYAVIKKSGVFKPLEELALYVACLCHDLDHRGKTNQFLVNSESPLAAIYSTSVLEHHHFNMTVSILQVLKQDGHNIFRNLSSVEYKKVLNNIKMCILSTDLALFFHNKAKLTKIVQDDQFDWNSSEHRQLLQAITMTACDLCASAKSWEEQKHIVKVIFEEFYDQVANGSLRILVNGSLKPIEAAESLISCVKNGDVEKEQGRQPLAIMDRNKSHEQPVSQVGFLQGICIPCYELLYSIIPEAEPLLIGVKANLKIWQDLSESQDNEEPEPSVEDSKPEETVEGENQ